MVIDLISQVGFGGFSFALDFLGNDLKRQTSKGLGVSRPWALIQVIGPQFVYPPALPREVREALSAQRLFFVKAHEAQAPWVAQRMLESGLCEGVVLAGCDRFARFSPASLWAKRWQLAARATGSHLLWVHERSEASVGFDVRLEWTAPRSFEIKRGYGFFEKQEGNRVALRNRLDRSADQPAA